MNINNINGATIPPTMIQGESKTDATTRIDNSGKLQSAIEKPEEASDITNSPSINATLKVTNELNELMDDLQTNLGFYIREDMDHQIVVEIKDKSTDELVRQIPSEEMLLIKDKMLELNGLIFDQKA